MARAFSSLGWENFAEPDFDGVAADLLWCGPDGAAGARVEGLISEVRLRPVRVGGLDQLGLVDMLVGLWFALAFGQGHGRRLAFKVLFAWERPAPSRAETGEELDVLGEVPSSGVGVRCAAGAMRHAGSGPLAHLPQQSSSPADR